MPVPKRKRSRARRDSRFANKGLEVKSFTSCANCASPLVPHVVCQKCGHYKGIKVLTTKLDRAEKRLHVLNAKKTKEVTKDAAPAE
jgi:large subunit ribosomal protein L32